MATRYSQIFTLKDLFCNKKLKDKLPYIDYKNNKNPNTESSNIEQQILSIATAAATPFYEKLSVNLANGRIEINGKSSSSIETIADTVYNAILAQKDTLSFSAENLDIIKSALKETDNNKKNNGINSKLYLKVQSIQQIQGMSKPQLKGLMENILENIFYGDDFPQTQKAFNLENFAVNSPFNYNQRKMRWKNKVGDV